MEFNRKTYRKLVFTICGIILFTYVLFRFENCIAALKWVLSLLMPFIIGFAIAFIINVPMKAFENVLFKNESGRFHKFRRPVCLVLSLFCVVIVLTFVITRLIPEISDTMSVIGEKFPGFMERVKDRAQGLSKDYPEIAKRIMEIDIDWDSMLDTVFDMMRNGGSSLVSSTFSFATSLVSAVIDIAVGIFFAIYILMQKETLKRQCKGLLYTFFKESAADKMIKTCAMADVTFTNFISGQCLEACILGLMFFVSMSLFHIPYALTVSITIAVTALIPVFGSFVGCGIGTFLILVDDPKKVIVFLILFIVLQQIEGNLIYPHVVGGSVGLPSIWVLAAVIVGGNLMGIVGMLIFVPIFSVAYALIKEYVINTLKEKKIAKEKYCDAYDIPDRTWKSRSKRKKEQKCTGKSQN